MPKKLITLPPPMGRPGLNLEGAQHFRCQENDDDDNDDDDDDDDDEDNGDANDDGDGDGDLYDDDDDDDDGGGDDDDDDNDDHTCQDKPQQSVKWSGSPGLGQLKEVSTSSAKMFVVFIQHR